MLSDENQKHENISTKRLRSIFVSLKFCRWSMVPKIKQSEKLWDENLSMIFSQVLRLLQIAWDRRLTFTIGTSVTTGVANTIVWNEIHHKTEPTSNCTGHGYPDPNYLDNVLAELATQGVEDMDDEVEQF